MTPLVCTLKFFCPRRVVGRELREFLSLSAYYLCAKAKERKDRVRGNFLLEVVSAKGVRVPIGVLGRGGVQVGGWGWFPVENKGKGGRRWGGWGGDRQRNRQVDAHALVIPTL